MIIPLKMLFEKDKKHSQNSHLSIESSMLTPFCIFLDVSTVKNNSTIWQFGDSGSFEQSYWRKLIILKSSIALTPLKTLFTGFKSHLFRFIEIWCRSRSLRQLHKLFVPVLRNQIFCQLWMCWHYTDLNQADDFQPV